MPQFEVITRDFLGETDKNHVKPQSGKPVSNPRSGPGIFLIRRKSAASSTAMVGDVIYIYIYIYI
jgi:hypothetical protein